MRKIKCLIIIALAAAAAVSCAGKKNNENNPSQIDIETESNPSQPDTQYPNSASVVPKSDDTQPISTFKGIGDYEEIARRKAELAAKNAQYDEERRRQRGESVNQYVSDDEMTAQQRQQLIWNRAKLIGEQVNDAFNSTDASHTR